MYKNFLRDKRHLYTTGVGGKNVFVFCSIKHFKLVRQFVGKKNNNFFIEKTIYNICPCVIYSRNCSHTRFLAIKSA